MKPMTLARRDNLAEHLDYSTDWLLVMLTDIRRMDSDAILIMDHFHMGTDHTGKRK